MTGAVPETSSPGNGSAGNSGLRVIPSEAKDDSLRPPVIDGTGKAKGGLKRMDYTQLTDRDTQEMLATIGAESIDALFAGIPAGARLNRLLNIPPALTEMELLADLQRLADANATCDEQVCFLGGGAYDHFIPTVVDDLAGQSEFVTAYTPYQAEASQGSLQAFYEYQTMICQITGMDVSNASLYEGATSAAEGVLMARAVNGRKRVVVSSAVHPHTRDVLSTYVRELPIDLVEVETTGGVTNPDDLRRALDDETSALLVQSPNFFGAIEPLDRLSAIVHERGGLVIASVDPVSCFVLKRPGDLGADIVVGDGQSLGIPLSYGGPSLGFMACRQKYMRKLPGRLIGATTDRQGRRAYCLTLQTREQHIRRERATSNICTNQGLLALRVAVYLSAMGKRGAARIASLCLDKAHYAARQIAALDGFDLRFQSPFFKEFVVRTTKDVSQVLAHARQQGILGGLELKPWYPQMADCFLVAVTEKRTRSEIDALVQALKEA